MVHASTYYRICGTAINQVEESEEVRKSIQLYTLLCTYSRFYVKLGINTQHVALLLNLKICN